MSLVKSSVGFSVLFFLITVFAELVDMKKGVDFCRKYGFLPSTELKGKEIQSKLISLTNSKIYHVGGGGNYR